MRVHGRLPLCLPARMLYHVREPASLPTGLLIGSLRMVDRLSLPILLSLLWCSASELAMAQPAPLKPLARLESFDDWIMSVAFSPDGEQLAAGSYGVIKVFSVADHALQTSISVDSGNCTSLVFTPDGKLLVVGSYQSVTLFETDSWKPVVELKGHRGQVQDLALSPDASVLASASDDESIRIWTMAERRQLRVIEVPDYPVNGVVFAPDAATLFGAVGDRERVTQNGLVHRWKVATGELVHTFPEHKRAATAVALTSDGAFLLSTSIDETVNVYSVESGEAIGFYGGHSRPTNCLVLSADGTRVVTGSGGRARGKNEIRVWNRADGEELGLSDTHSGQVTDLALAPDGRLLASASYDKSVMLWDVSELLGAQRP